MEQAQVGLPPETAVPVAQVLEEETAHVVLGDLGAQRGVRLGAVADVAQVQALQGAQQVLEVAPPGTGLLRTRRGDVHDHEPAHEFRVTQGQDHGDLAAHRVAHHVHGTVRGEGLTQLGGHGIRHGCVAEALGPGGLTVVGQVHEQAAELGSQSLGDVREVLAAAEEPVQEHDAMLAVSHERGLHEGFLVLGHGPNLLCAPTAPQSGHRPARGVDAGYGAVDPGRPG